MEFPIFELLFDSGPIGLGILLLLLLGSIIVWTLFFRAHSEIRQRKRENQKVVESLQWEKPLQEQRESLKHLSQSSFRSLYETCLEEYQSTVETNRNLYSWSDCRELLENICQQHLIEEEQRLQSKQVWFATISVTAPFIGLFGTVVGVINTFQNIGYLQSIELSVVAPGIAEALVATGAGLFTAIPASIAFNYCRAHIRSIQDQMETFSLQLLRYYQKKMIYAEKTTSR